MGVAGLFEEIKEVLSGGVFENEEEEGRGLESAVQGDDIWVGRERLV